MFTTWLASTTVSIPLITNVRIKRTRSTLTREWHSATERKDALKCYHAGACGNMMLSEKSQAQKATCYMVAFI